MPIVRCTKCGIFYHNSEGKFPDFCTDKDCGARLPRYRPATFSGPVQVIRDPKTQEAS